LDCKGKPSAALDINRIEAKVVRMETPTLTNMGRPALVAGTRELIEWPYIIVYSVDDERDEIVIVSVAHAAQDRE